MGYMYITSPYRFPRLAILIFSAHRTDGVVELTFEIPAAEGSDHLDNEPRLRRESSSNASGESVPREKTAAQKGESQVLCDL